MAHKKKQVKDYRTELEKMAIQRYFNMTDGSQVRVLDFNFSQKPYEYTILLIPGFLTVFQSWQRVIELLTREFRVLYFESREKVTSKVPKKLERKITFPQMAYDIKEVVEQLDLSDKKYIALCSSTGGNILTQALSNKLISPTGAIMIGPAIEFHISGLVTFLSAITPNFMIQGVFIPLVRRYMTRVYINKKEEPEQLEKYIRALEEGNLRKALPTFRRMYRYKIWDQLPNVVTKTLLVGASLDKMHATEETLKAHNLMPNSLYIDLGSNKETHSDPLVIELKNFIEKLEKNSNNMK
ncbi:MAG TPA: alpha/beta hydrolase [Candidatus Bathyarchaeia archaeon]|nr:alpha/beta hydrolase [Candidatus Bathyarchaeia archaeon]